MREADLINIPRRDVLLRAGNHRHEILPRRQRLELDLGRFGIGRNFPHLGRIDPLLPVVQPAVHARVDSETEAPVEVHPPDRRRFRHAQIEARAHPAGDFAFERIPVRGRSTQDFHGVGGQQRYRSLPRQRTVEKAESRTVAQGTRGELGIEVFGVDRYGLWSLSQVFLYPPRARLPAGFDLPSTVPMA